MKTLLLLISALLISLQAFNQKTYLQRIPVFPTSINPDALETFNNQLTALKEEIDAVVAKYEAENQEAASKIDPSAVAAAYSQGMDVMNMQKRTEEMMANQNKLTTMLQHYDNYDDSINSAFKNDLSFFDKKYTAFSEKCTGEGGDAASCNKIKIELNALGKDLLLKYWFDEKTAEYRKYLYSIRDNLQPLHVLCSVQSLESSEITTGIKFPHKEDLGYLKFTLDYISFIRDAWSIDSRLWPMH